MQILESLSLHQVVTEPTHRHGNILDLVLVQDPERVSSLQVDKNLSISDHSLVTFQLSLKLETTEHPPVIRRPLRRMNMAHFVRDVEAALSSLTLDGTSLDESLVAINMALTSTLDAHAPAKKIRPKGDKQKSWYDDEIHRERQKRRRLERKFRKTMSHVHLEMWKEQSVKVVRLIDEKKKAYFQSRLCSATSKEAFNLIDKLLAKDKTMTLPSDEPGVLAQKFSSFFRQKIATITDTLDKHTIQHVNRSNGITVSCSSSLMNFQPVTEFEVRQRILASSPKTCSLDPLPSSLLRTPELLNILLPHYTALINKSLTTGKVPCALKIAQVSPRIKKPDLDREVLKNYRPVSNIPFLSKILERIVVNQLNDYLRSNNLCDELQSAYKTCHSTETTMLKVKTDLEQIMDSGDAALLVLLDLSAAFDTVDHNVLLTRVEKELGIKGNALSWLQSYLEDRKQFVAINETHSQSTILDVGVPQGSVMGPILFLLYTLPLKRIVNKFPVIRRHSYADDTQLYCRLSVNNLGDAREAIREMNACVASVREWLLSNRLLINDSKTEVVLIGNKRARSLLKELEIRVTVGESTISPSSSARDLGIIIDESLSLEQHVGTVAKAAYFHLRRIRQIRQHLTKEACSKAIHACVTSRLDYGNALLLGCSAATKKRLQVVQNNAARVLLRIRDRRAHISPVLMDLHWLPIEHRIAYKVLLTIHGAIHNITFPAYIQSFVEFYVPMSSLRSANDSFTLVPSNFNVRFGRNSFIHTGFKLWNDLPNTLRSLTSTPVFKSKLKTYLFTLSYM